MPKRICILGGYGGVGRPLARLLLAHTDCALCIAGRNQEKANAFASSLSGEYPARSITPWGFDARNTGTLRKHLEDVDLLIVTATIPDAMGSIGQAAIASGVDLMDILVRGDVVDALSPFSGQLEEQGRTWITQCGFHPGLIKPIMTMAKPNFDTYLDAKVFMAMAPVFETAASLREIMHEVIVNKAMVLENGRWRKATYRDMCKASFDPPFGEKNCYPLPMREIENVDQDPGLVNAGVYATGFNWFVDYLVFPLTMLLGYLNVDMAERLGSRLMYWNTRKYANRKPLVEVRLLARGIKDGKEKEMEISIHSEDGYQMTAFAVLGCIKQLLDPLQIQPGLHLMGNCVEPERLLGDLRQWGLDIRTPDPGSSPHQTVTDRMHISA